jgi:hypothetical protein
MDKLSDMVSDEFDRLNTEIDRLKAELAALRSAVQAGGRDSLAPPLGGLPDPFIYRCPGCGWQGDPDACKKTSVLECGADTPYDEDCCPQCFKVFRQFVTVHRVPLSEVEPKR